MFVDADGGRLDPRVGLNPKVVEVYTKCVDHQLMGRAIMS